MSATTLATSEQKLPNPGSIQKEDAVKKMLADQKLIREAIQNGISFQELREKHGFKFATI